MPRASSPPFIPETESMTPVLMAKITTRANPDLDPDQLPAAAKLLMPQAPLGSGYIYDDAERADVTATWANRFDTYGVSRPDGTGFRGCYCAHLRTSVMWFAMLMQSIFDFRVCPELNYALNSSSASGQCKTDKDGNYPKSTADVLKDPRCRPLSAPCQLRKWAERPQATASARHTRADLEAEGQYGMSKDGAMVGSHGAQLRFDLAIPRHIMCAADCEHAYGLAGRRSIYTILASNWQHSRHPTDKRVLQSFLMYSHGAPLRKQGFF